jgi:hypothetical protein
MVRGLIIDDTPSREDEFRGAWGRPRNLSLDFRTPGDFETGGPDLVKEINPDIVLVDLILNVVLDNIAQRRFQWEGVVIAAEVKQAVPLIPVYGYSSDREKVLAYNGSDSSHLNFDQVWELSELFRFGHRALISDSADYAKVASTVPEYGRIRSVRPYADLLAPPRSARSGIEEIVRSDFLDRNSSRLRNASDFSKWVRWTLLTTPGPLKTRDYLAKLLGVSERGMKRVEVGLKRAEYRGPFYHSSPRAWWGAEVERLLVERAGDGSLEAGGVLSKLASIGFSLKKSERVNCGVCGEPDPEAVATTNIGSDPLPVHVRCSRHHFGRMDRLRFDEPREYSRQ